MTTIAIPSKKQLREAIKARVREARACDMYQEALYPSEQAFTQVDDESEFDQWKTFLREHLQKPTSYDAAVLIGPHPQTSFEIDYQDGLNRIKKQLHVIDWIIEVTRRTTESLRKRAKHITESETNIQGHPVDLVLDSVTERFHEKAKVLFANIDIKQQLETAVQKFEEMGTEFEQGDWSSLELPEETTPSIDPDAFCMMENDQPTIVLAHNIADGWSLATGIGIVKDAFFRLMEQEKIKQGQAAEYLQRTNPAFLMLNQALAESMLSVIRKTNAQATIILQNCVDTKWMNPVAVLGTQQRLNWQQLLSHAEGQHNIIQGESFITEHTHLGGQWNHKHTVEQAIFTPKNSS